MKSTQLWNRRQTRLIIMDHHHLSSPGTCSQAGILPHDMVLSVCGFPFPAQTRALCEHFGYFKSLLNNSSNTSDAMASPVLKINGVSYLNLASLIPYEVFSILYSGIHRSDGLFPLLTQGNAYQVLLYAQVLQMAPVFIEQIRHFIVMVNSTLEHHPMAARIYRPVPNRPVPAVWNNTPPVLEDPVTQMTTVDTTTKVDKEDLHLPKQEVEEAKVREDGEEDEILDVGDVEDEKENQLAIGMLNNSSPEVNQKPGPAMEVASCDGPVHFKRVLNPLLASSSLSDEDTDSKPGPSQSMYKCVFCNHAFKSYYCYQKHKRRHLNPLTVDFKKKLLTREAELPETPTAKDEENSPDLMKDINVQFFPCKICGSKFPSYYFVHKHKKMWHDDHPDSENSNEVPHPRASSVKSSTSASIPSNS